MGVILDVLVGPVASAVSPETPIQDAITEAKALLETLGEFDSGEAEEIASRIEELGGMLEARVESLIEDLEGSEEPRDWDLSECGNYYDTVKAGSAEDALEIACNNVDRSNYDDIEKDMEVEVRVRCALTGESDSQTVTLISDTEFDLQEYSDQLPDDIGCSQAHEAGAYLLRILDALKAGNRKNLVWECELPYALDGRNHAKLNHVLAFLHRVWSKVDSGNEERAVRLALKGIAADRDCEREVRKVINGVFEVFSG